MDNKKRRKKGKILLFIGLLPLIIAMAYILLSGVLGHRDIFEKSIEKFYGLAGMEEGMKEVLFYSFILPYISLPIALTSAVLIREGILLLIKKPKNKDTDE